ncbi:MAG: winged helix-turn-helix domain-containing protein [Thermoanaerobaculia bacterium]
MRLDGDRREAFVDGVELPLTEREFLVLEQLVASRGLRRQELLETVWGEATAEAGASFDVILSRLRRKLASRDLADAIETVRGFGLRWREGE